MKQIFLSILFFLLIASPIFCQTKKICITVDDLPVVTYGVQDTAYSQKVIQGIVLAATKHKIPLIGYVVEGTMYTDEKIDSFKVHLLEYWVNHGYDLGNHTYSHMDYNNVTVADYTADIVKGEQITRALLKNHNKSLMYFRHPYLHTGATKALSDSLIHVLDSLHYVSAPVTMDNDDYVFANAYNQAYLRKDRVEMRYIGKEYVAYMERKLIHFENVSSILLHRSIAQTVLIHASLLNADYLTDLIVMYKKHGYTCIAQHEVLQDEAYMQPILSYSKKGNSWLYRWANKDLAAELMIGDPEVPEKISNLLK